MNETATPKRSGKAPFEKRFLLIVAGALLFPSILALLLVWFGSFSLNLRWTVTGVLVVADLISLYLIRDRLAHPLRTVANLLWALREEDYSIRGRGARADDALGEVMIEINALGKRLRENRLDSLEAYALLRTIMREIDAAIFAFDGDDKLRLVNRAGERLLARPAERLIGESAAQLGLDKFPESASTDAVEMAFPGATGRWSIRRSRFREKGLAHQLLVITDLSRALREEERLAWQRIVRVLGHELNNSLAPIKSVAGSLASLLDRDPLPPDWTEDASRGLGVISARVEALTRFMDAYSKLARLPAPRLRAVRLPALVRRVTDLETRIKVRVESGPDVELSADEDQLEQLLINILRNAVEAAQETGGGVTVCWRAEGAVAELSVLDDGPGLSGSTNLFVPFFTTKPGGTGIGLVLSRQIAEAHGGSLTLNDRQSGRGCQAVLRLPRPESLPEDFS